MLVVSMNHSAHVNHRQLAVLTRHATLIVLLCLAGCQAFGNLTTDTMVTTNRATGNPPVVPSH